MSKIIVTVLGVGYIPIASGTFGSLAALPLAWLLDWAGGFPLLAAATLVAFGAGWVATAAHTARTGVEDPSEVVIDELVGQWIALLPVSVWMACCDPGASSILAACMASFFLFRFFDIAKPGVVGWADRMETPLGVMLDDVFAGLLSAACMSVALAVLS